jgi:thioredoxin 1
MLETLAALVLLALPAAAEEPFADLELDAALAKAKAVEKLLVVDFTADWCPPCKKMDKDTWAAERVRAWLAENAIALQIDVDAEPELAQRFEVQGLPTVVAFRAGEEFDRFIGYRDAARFLEWAQAVKEGRSSADALKARATALRDSDDVKARHDLAQELLRAGQYDEALHHYLWLWPATRTADGYGGVRHSFMLREIVELAQRHGPAKKAFAAILDELQTRIDAAPKPAFEDWAEWTAFSKYLGQPQRVIAWYESHRDAEGRLFDGETDFLSQHIVSEVFDVLMEAERWQDATRLYGDARERAAQMVKDYERQADTVEGMQPGMRKDVLEFARGRLTDEASKLYAAMLLAGRTDEAGKVAALLLETLDTPEARMALVRQGMLIAGTIDPRFEAWLDEAEAAGGDVASLRRRLARLAERQAERRAAGGESQDG